MNNNNNKISRKPFCTRFGWLLIIVCVLIVLTIVLTTIFVVRAKRVSQSSNSSTIYDKPNLSVKGLLTVETAKEKNVCHPTEPIEDCVLIHNAKIIMSVMLLASSKNSTTSFTFSQNFTGNDTDCKGIRLRRSQLSQIFEASTLATIYDLSGISYKPDEIEILTPQINARTQIDSRSLRSRWNTTIYYYISTTTGLTSSIIANIRTAIANWESNTCLKFIEMPFITPETDKSYVLFQRDDEYGCSSPVGYDRFDPTSVILISINCGGVVGSIMHEIGHTLGYIHTQSRVDRNSYITIETSNIRQEFISNFFMWSYGTIRFADTPSPYDYASLMHYDTYAFSQNNQPTIVALDSRYERTMGQRERATFYDYKLINRLYCVRQDCPQMFNSNNCQNNGYLDPQTCSRCICPEGFSGQFCDQKDLISNCGDTITISTPHGSAQFTIENPAPTSPIPTEQYCVYLIRSLLPGKIRFRLDSINTQRRSVCSLSSLVEVKYLSDMALTGARWCGRTIPSAWTNITAETNTMMVIFRATNFLDPSTGSAQAGFRATVFLDAEATDVTSQTPFTLPTIPPTITTTSTTTSSILSTTVSSSSSICPPSSFRCQLPTQPTCGGCLTYQPCNTQGIQQCLAFNYQIQLTDCDKIVNGTAQCRYQFVQTPYVTTCQRTILLCCPNYQLITIGTSYFCIYNPQTTNLPSEWSLVL